MAVEQIRGCGWRKVNALYLVGDYTFHEACDRMPFPLTVCPVCGQGIKVSRGFTQINPYQLWGLHRDCKDNFRPCHLCDPQDQPAYIMLVGAGNYKTPQEFVREAIAQGISKRIPFIPKDLELGKTVIYLAHPKACEVKEPALLQEAMAIVEEAQTKQPKLLEAERIEKALGIFCAFIPKRVEKLIWDSEYTDKKREEAEKRGITLVQIPDGDADHA
ncbi:hypothetical protein ES703_29211 [subsurface metagenome]